MAKVIVIAEAGVNHNGSIESAKELIDIASVAGADYVKFQTFKAESLVTKLADKADYQKVNTHSDESQFEMLKKLELDFDTHKCLIEYSMLKKIKFLSTAFDLMSVDLLDDLNIPLYKIPSGEINNVPLLRHIGCKGKPVIISTGMSTLDEVEFALNTVMKTGLNKENITILHCNTEYPTPMKDVNLRAMLELKDKLGVNIGYSDHTLGIEIPIAAVALGAIVIEKHFTKSRALLGPDHAASLEPNELKSMITSIRNIEKAMGDGIKRPSNSERKNIYIARKSLVANNDIKKGEIFTEKNLTVKRPGLGVPPSDWDVYIGKKSDQAYKKDDLIK